MYVKAAAKFRKRLKKKSMARQGFMSERTTWSGRRQAGGKNSYCANISAKALLATVTKGSPTRSDRRKIIEEIEDVSLYLRVLVIDEIGGGLRRFVRRTRRSQPARTMAHSRLSL